VTANIFHTIGFSCVLPQLIGSGVKIMLWVVYSQGCSSGKRVLYSVMEKKWN